MEFVWLGRFLVCMLSCLVTIDCVFLSCYACCLYMFVCYAVDFFGFFFFNDTATTEIYTRSLVGSVRCV